MSLKFVISDNLVQVPAAGVASGGGTLAIPSGKTATISNTLTLTATDGSSLAVGAGGSLGSAAFLAQTAVVPVDTGWTANSTAGDKTAVLAAYTNGLDATMITALNVVSAGIGTALSAALDTIALLVKKTAALETALVANKRPNA